MMNKLEEYEEHLKAYNKPPLMVSTWLNQKRFLDYYETIKIDFSQKWQEEILKEQSVPQEYVNLILLERDKWVATNPKKELTTHIFNEMIKKYYINNNYERNI